MLIAFDIPHLADFNLFKNAIIILSQKGYAVNVYVLNRGCLCEIVKHELPKTVNVIPIGSWKKGKIGKIFVTNLYRILLLYKALRRQLPIIGISPGSISFSIALKILKIPNIQFSDDIERWMINYVEGVFATEKYFPKVTKKYRSKKIFKINMLKQWAYLSPKYFQPNIDILPSYNLTPKSYFFVREISTKSYNYKNQTEFLISKICSLFPENTKIVLSLEDKSVSSLYPKDWIILNEPVRDIHSLIYFSKALISSGDSMAREGAILGIPSIYCGVRSMEVNAILEREGMLFHLNYKEVPEFLNKIIENKLPIEDQEEFRNRISAIFIELSDFIVSRAETLINRRLS